MSPTSPYPRAVPRCLISNNNRERRKQTSTSRKKLICPSITGRSLLFVHAKASRTAGNCGLRCNEQGTGFPGSQVTRKSNRDRLLSPYGSQLMTNVVRQHVECGPTVNQCGHLYLLLVVNQPNRQVGHGAHRTKRWIDFNAREMCTDHDPALSSFRTRSNVAAPSNA